jgi:hypothetical protein
MNSIMLVADPPNSGWRCNICNWAAQGNKVEVQTRFDAHKCEEHSGKKKPIREDVNKAVARSVKKANER